jgi:hypothetical protein
MAPEADRTLATDSPEGAAEFTTILAQQPSRSTETSRRLADTLNLVARAASAPAPSAATTMADRQGAFRHTEARAWAAAHVAAVPVAEEGTVAEGGMVVGEGITDRGFVMFLVVGKI